MTGKPVPPQARSLPQQTGQPEKVQIQIESARILTTYRPRRRRHGLLRSRQHGGVRGHIQDSDGGPLQLRDSRHPATANGVNTTVIQLLACFERFTGVNYHWLFQNRRTQAGAGDAVRLALGIPAVRLHALLPAVARRPLLRRGPIPLGRNHLRLAQHGAQMVLRKSHTLVSFI